MMKYLASSGRATALTDDQRDEVKVVNLHLGTQRQSYNCSPQCNPSIIIGDEQAYFDSVSKASEKKLGFSERAADSTGQSSGQ